MHGAGAKPPRREVYWTSQAERDRGHWRQRDRRILAKIDRLVEDILEHPFAGIGKPEPLRYEWSVTGLGGLPANTDSSTG